MKTSFLPAIAGVVCILGFFFSCEKEKAGVKANIVVKDSLVVNDSLVVKTKPDTCATVSSKGRIIGFDQCYHFSDSVKVMGRGFIIEIDNGATRDTAVTYGIPDGIFKFFPSYGSNTYAGLFKIEIQNKLRIKFNYRLALDNEKTGIPCIAIYSDSHYRWTKGKEIFISCVSAQ